MMQRDIILTLIRHGIGKETILSQKNYQNVDWKAIEAFAVEQGLSGVIIDGIDKVQSSEGLNVSVSLPLQMKLEWIGEVLQNYEQRYMAYRKAISDLAGFYNQHGIKMMVLKGYACALDWPKPNHRPCGDIDVWLFGKQKMADAVLSSWFKGQGSKARIDNGHHHHTIFEWKEFTVENHYDFINVHGRHSNKGLEQIFKELGQDDTHFVEVNGEKLYLPSPNLHALFLMRHLVAHFASVSITFRQILDWAFFLEKHTNEIDWNWLIGALKEYHMYDFYNCINAICVGDLGFDVKISPTVQFDPSLKDRVLNDIFNPKYGVEEPKGFIKRLAYKYKRWQGNAWKQELCFPESRTSSFMTGLWSHITKPAHL